MIPFNTVTFERLNWAPAGCAYFLSLIITIAALLEMEVVANI